MLQKEAVETLNPAFTELKTTQASAAHHLITEATCYQPCDNCSHYFLSKIGRTALTNAGLTVPNKNHDPSSSWWKWYKESPDLSFHTLRRALYDSVTDNNVSNYTSIIERHN